MISWDFKSSTPKKPKNHESFFKYGISISHVTFYSKCCVMCLDLIQTKENRIESDNTWPA